MVTVTLREKTVGGLIWSFIGSFSEQGLNFIVGIFLARILTPREFGLIGMTSIFIALSASLIDSGFSNALIRKKDCNQEDYSTVFYFNILLGILIATTMFFVSSSIGNFFNELQLKPIIQVLSIGVLIQSFGVIQRTIFIKEINFKKQANISVITSLGSGILASVSAFYGAGVWSLVTLVLSRYVISTLLFWLWSNWRPSLVFRMQAFKELFAFGSKLLLSGLVYTINRNVFYLIIGKHFSAAELGYYTRAEQFQTLPSSNLFLIISRVSYPVLSSIQSDSKKMLNYYKKLLRSTMFITSVLMFGMASVGENMIVVFIGEQWLPVVAYLQLLCFVGVFYPLSALNLNMLQVKGRSDLFLRLELIKTVLSIPIIVIGIYNGIIPMIFAMIIVSFFAYYLNAYWSDVLIGYSIKSQILDLLPSFGIASTMAIIVYTIGFICTCDPLIALILQIFSGLAIIIAMSEFTKNRDYFEIKKIMLSYTKRANR